MGLIIDKQGHARSLGANKPLQYYSELLKGYPLKMDHGE